MIPTTIILLYLLVHWYVDFVCQTDKQAKRKFEILMKQMLQKNPIDEHLKDTDPLKWTGIMNNYKCSAEEIIFKELIYI